MVVRCGVSSGPQGKGQDEDADAGAVHRDRQEGRGRAVERARKGEEVRSQCLSEDGPPIRSL
jgi:hypothetical protein